MIKRGEGVILNQASMTALVGIDDIFPYTAAKGGVVAHDQADGARPRGG